MTMTTTTETITPTLAAAYLEKNTANRPVNKRHLAFLVGEMKSGSWGLTHEGIAFDGRDVLIDGQHRLMAVIASGVTIKALVTRGCEPKTFAVIGNGSRRTTSDVLALKGEINTTRLSSTASVALSGLCCRPVSRHEITALIDGPHGHVIRAIANASKGTTGTPGAVTGAVARAVITGAMSLDDGVRMVEAYRKMDWSGSTDPVCRLHHAVHAAKTLRAKYAFAVRAIEHFVAGRKVDKAYQSTVDFPEIDQSTQT